MLAGLKATSVSEILHQIKTHLEKEFSEVYIEGEISNLSTAASGHWYFNLSDGDSSLSCALFRGDALRNPYAQKLKNGDKVVVYGPLSVYSKRGTFQVIVKRVMPAGEGQLQWKLEQLKKRLSAEGLFDLDRKRSIPKYPKKIALITSEHGAALHDFLNVIKRRTLFYDILIIPALVQGDEAPRSLLSALQKAQKVEGVDVIVLTRGGGSTEDLWAFNDEELVREISRTEIPIISAIGHEVDFTLCDFVSDHRSETPTAAAETLSQPQLDLKLTMERTERQFKLMLGKLNQEILIYKRQYHPEQLLAKFWELIRHKSRELDRLVSSLKSHDLTKLYQLQIQVDDLWHDIALWMEEFQRKLITRLERSQVSLAALDPKAVLSRGYSFLTGPKEQVISSHREFTKLKDNEILNIHFHDGTGVVKK